MERLWEFLPSVFMFIYKRVGLYICTVRLYTANGCGKYIYVNFWLIKDFLTIDLR